MSYQEKRVIVSFITGAALLTVYCIYAFGPSGLGAAADLKDWAILMLKFVGIGIGANIAIQIIFHIFLSIGMAVTAKIRNESTDDKDLEKSIQAEMMEDERDKLIERKSTWIGFLSAGIGFIAGLVLLATGYSAVVMLNTLFISFFVGSLLEGVAQLAYYRQGLRHG